MNQLKGKIVHMESSDTMSLVDVEVKGDIFSAIVLDLPKDNLYLKMENEVILLFKETEVSIAKNLSGMISLRNRIKSKIQKIEKAPILTKVILDYKSTPIVSIISTRSTEKLQLKVGDEVEWLVKTNEMALAYGLPAGRQAGLTIGREGHDGL